MKSNKFFYKIQALKDIKKKINNVNMEIQNFPKDKQIQLNLNIRNSFNTKFILKMNERECLA